jgi:hypothetical protein
VNALEGEVIILMGDNGQKQVGSAVDRGVGKKYRLAVTLNQKQWNEYVMSILQASTRRRFVLSV